jgi:adenine/guanine phosphoribosyltransferase-like PRPP-binding protein
MIPMLSGSCGEEPHQSSIPSGALTETPSPKRRSNPASCDNIAPDEGCSESETREMNMRETVEHAPHLLHAILPRNRLWVVDNTIAAIEYNTKQKGIQFDAIAVRGLSGLLIGPTVAMMMDKNIVVVRKDIDDTHSKFRAEGTANGMRYIIVDDFTESGATVCSMLEILSTKGCTCVGLMLYAEPSFYGPESTYLKDRKFRWEAIPF